MSKDEKEEISREEEREDNDSEPSDEIGSEFEKLKQDLSEANDKYIRLYADYENYRKSAARNKEELLKYANEDLMSDLLTVIDHLELALQHTGDNDASTALAEGVELTLKELKTTLEKHGLVCINSSGAHFDPSIHHAMSQVESEDVEENTIVKEFRKGYMLRDRVLRASLVGVAKKQSQGETSESGDGNNENSQTNESKNNTE